MSTEEERTAEQLLEESAEELLGEAEPWEAWETQLLVWCFGIAVVGLVTLGFLINTYIL